MQQLLAVQNQLPDHLLGFRRDRLAAVFLFSAVHESVSADVESQKADTGVNVSRQTSRPARARSNLVARPR
jgi:hypothetical protein